MRRLANTPHDVFTTRGAYQTLHPIAANSIDFMYIWKMKLPNKVKFFGWLLFLGRLNTRTHLHHRNLRGREESNCKLCHTQLETDAHIFVECPRARDVWLRLGHLPLPGQHRTPWALGSEPPLPDQARPDVMLLLLWHIWKARNALIFNRDNLSTMDVLRRVLHDLEIWRCRYGRLSLYVDLWKD